LEETLDEWLIGHLKGAKVDRSGSDEWINQFVKLVDYVGNSEMTKLNCVLLDELSNGYLIALDQNP